MSLNHRGPPETPEGAAWELFLEIVRREEKDAQSRGNNEPLRARLLDLYAECLTTARGDRRRETTSLSLH